MEYSLVRKKEERKLLLNAIYENGFFYYEEENGDLYGRLSKIEDEISDIENGKK